MSRDVHCIFVSHNYGLLEDGLTNRQTDGRTRNNRPNNTSRCKTEQCKGKKGRR